MSTVLASFPDRPVWPPGLRRALWLEQALAGESAPVRRVAPPERADVCIVGGGFTGLWAALALKRREPSLGVVLLEADVCGGGASGRNGGFVMTAWSKFASLSKLCGSADALRYAQACDGAVDSIGRFLDESGIDGDFRRAGWLWTATNRAQLGAWEPTLGAITAAGATPFERLSREEVAARAGSDAHLGGVFEPGAATFHPAKVARGLARVARERDIGVHEAIKVLRVESGPPLRVVTDRGALQADRVLLSLNAWTAAIPEAARALVVVSSDVIATDPIPHRLDELGWAPGLSISDSRRLVSYYQRAADDRVVFGKGGGTLAFNGHVGAGLHGDSGRVREVEAQMRHNYPRLADVPVPRSWRGPVDYSISGLPFVFQVGGHPGVLAAAGFSGNGCGPSYVVGDALAAMALGRPDHDLPEAMRRLPAGRLPPEPLRYVGGRLVRWAIARKERAEDAGRRPDTVTRSLAALDPTGLVDRS